MFERIQLFTKPDNKVQFPNREWNERTTIHCSFEINLGFGTGTLIWDTGCSIKLRKLIDFYKAVNSLNSSNDNCQIELLKDDFSYLFNWTIDVNNELKLSVYRKYYKSTRLVTERKFQPYEIGVFTRRFFFTIVSILSRDTNDSVTSSIGELLLENQQDIEYKFKAGHFVRTIIRQDVKTYREGVIIDRFYHHRNQTTMYKILVKGKIIDKWYLPDDLERIEYL